MRPRPLAAVLELLLTIAIILWAAIIAHGTLDTAGSVMMYVGVYPGL